MAKASKGTKPKISRQDADRVSQTMAESINREFGAGSLMTLGNVNTNAEWPFQISTGSISLDIAIGPIRMLPDGSWQTGIPPARIVEMFGDEGSGKTTLALQTIASAQRKFRRLKLPLRTAFIDMEHAIDPEYAKHLGVRLDELDFCQPPSGDQAIEIIDRLLRTNQYGLIVCDSVASLVPQSELDGDVTDDHVGGQARLMSQAMRRFSSFLGVTSACKTILLFTNQTRSKIGGNAFSNPTTTPGGRALKFYANLRMEVTAGTAIYDNPDAQNFLDKVRIGHRLWVNVLKNKGFPPYRRSDSPLYYGKGVDFITEIAELCKLYGVVEQSGSWYRHACGLNANGIGAFIDQIRENIPAYVPALYSGLMVNVLASRGCNPDGTPIPGSVQDVRVDTDEVRP